MERSGNGPTDGMWQAIREFPPGGAGDPGTTAPGTERRDRPCSRGAVGGFLTWTTRS